MSDRPVSTPTSSSPDPADRDVRIQLAMFHAARDRGDRAEARRLWQLILAGELPRVRGIVARFPAGSGVPGGRIPAAEQEDVVHDVFLRLHESIGTLEGKSVGELRSFLRTATGFTCQDWVRAYVRRDRHAGGSIDATAEEPGGASVDLLARFAERLAADDDEALIAREVIHPALSMVDPAKRSVLIRDLAGFPVEETMDVLGISRDTLYQRRKRGLKELREAIEELAGEDGS